MGGLIVHEWIEKSGGAEKVVDAAMDAFPDAELWCLWNDAPKRYDGRKVHESLLSKTPLRGRKALAVPAMLPIWQNINVPTEPEWLLVSSHLFAHHATLRGVKVPKFVYAHTPARYIWEPELDRRGDSLVARTLSRMLKPLDRAQAAKADLIAANSEFIKDRIEYAWGREARVIYPPVQVEIISRQADWATQVSPEERTILDDLPPKFILGASRFVAYKSLDIVLRVAKRLDCPVVLAGRGPDEIKLRKLASDLSVDATFIISPSDELLYALYQRADVYLFPAVEDFGIMPVEAQAAGCPVVVSSTGGAKESIVVGQSGLVADMNVFDEVCQMVEIASQYPRSGVAKHTKKFSAERFRAEIRELVLTNDH